MNIFKYELKALIKSMIIWSLGISFWIIFYISFYPMLAADASAFEALMSDFPKEFLNFFGMGGEYSMTSLPGYFILTFSMSQIPIAIQAANYGVNMLSVEERELTADFLLTKPVKRSTIFKSKLAASIVSLTVVNIFVVISCIVVLTIFEDTALPWNGIYLSLSTIFLFQLFFVSVGMLISVTVKKIRSVMPFSMALGVGFYVLNSVALIFTSDFLMALTPYGHFSPQYILENTSYHIGFTVISLIIIIGSLAASYFLYQRRNIASL